MHSRFSCLGLLSALLVSSPLLANRLPATAVAASEVPGLEAVHLTDGSGLPPDFTAATRHADVVTGNAWLSADGAVTQGTAQVTFTFRDPAAPRSVIIWNNVSKPESLVTLTQLELFDARSNRIDSVNLELRASPVGQSFVLRGGGDVVTAVLTVKETAGADAAGLAEVVFDDGQAGPCEAGTPECDDTDGDGVLDVDELPGDSDRDGLDDFEDEDDDSDGIPTIDEGIGDPDEDRIPNYLDDDSDGDGTSDRGERGGGTDFLDACDPVRDVPECTGGGPDDDVDGDGWTTREELGAGTDPLKFDTDGDEIGDRADGRFDGDRDGIIAALDPDERGPSCGDGVTDCDQETCDDGNLVGGDGCSSLCNREQGVQEIHVLPARLVPVSAPDGVCSRFENGLVPGPDDILVFDADSADFGSLARPEVLSVRGVQLLAETQAVVVIRLVPVNRRPFVLVDGGQLILPAGTSTQPASLLESLTATGGAVSISPSSTVLPVDRLVQTNAVTLDPDVVVDPTSGIAVTPEPPAFGIVAIEGHPIAHLALIPGGGTVAVAGEARAERIELVGSARGGGIDGSTPRGPPPPPARLTTSALVHTIALGDSAIALALPVTTRTATFASTALSLSRSLQFLPGPAEATGIVGSIEEIVVPVGTSLTSLPRGSVGAVLVDGVAALAQNGDRTAIGRVHLREGDGEPLFAAGDGQRIGDLVIENGVFVGNDALFVTSSVTQTGGSWLAGASTVLGDADGAFTLDVGDTTFNGLTLQALSTSVGPRSVLRVNGTFTARGAPGANLTLDGFDGRPGEQWSVLPIGPVDIDFVAVGDSLNLREQPIVAATFVDLGNNTRWGEGEDDLCAGLIAVRDNVTLADDAAVAAFNDSGVQCVTGDVIVGAAVTAVVLEHLQVVGGTLRVIGTQAVVVEVPALESAGGVVIENNPALGSVDFGALGSVVGTIDVNGNPVLSAVTFPELTTVGGSLVIDNNTSLDTVETPALTTVGGSLTVSDNPSLTGLTLLLMTSAGAIEISGNDALIALVLALLQNVSGAVNVTNNGALTVLSIPTLTTVGGSLTITDNPELDVVDVEPTTIGGTLTVDDGVLPGSRCGDGVRIANEDCDDGNEDAADGCDAACDVEVGFVCGGALQGRSTCRADGDNDGVADVDDRCPRLSDDQTDTDGDGIGDACDNDDDDDGIADGDDDCGLVANAGRACDATAPEHDLDSDGIDDDVDNCRERANIAQLDSNGDGFGDACSGLGGPAGDRDDDGVADEEDLCPLAPTAVFDIDGDGLGAACDSDIDGDGVANSADACVAVEDDQQDGDGDGVGDACDACPALAGDVRGCPPGSTPPPSAPPGVVEGDCATMSPSSAGLFALFGLLLVRRRRVTTTSVAGAIAAVLLAAVPASAATRVWNGSADNRASNPANWGGGVVPVAGDDVVISGPDVLLDSALAVGSLQLSAAMSCAPGSVLQVTTSTTVSSFIDPACVFDVTGTFETTGIFSGTVVVSRPSTTSIVGPIVHRVQVDAGVVTVRVTALDEVAVGGGVLLAPQGLGVDATTITGGFIVADAQVRSRALAISGGGLSTSSALRISQSLSLTGSGTIVGRPSLTLAGGPFTVSLAQPLTVGELIVDEPDGEVTISGATLRVEGRTVLRGATDNRLRFVGVGLFPLDLLGGDADLTLEHLAVRNVQLLRGRFVAPVDFVDLGNTVGFGVAPSACIGRTAVTGDVVLTTDEEAIAFNDSGVQCIDGDLVFGGDVVFADLQALERVTGTIRVRDTRAIDIDVGGVTDSGGIDIGGNDQLTGIDLSALATVTGDVVVEDNDALITLDVSNLGDVGGNVTIVDNDGLTNVDTGGLTTVGGSLTVGNNDSLGSFDVPALSTVGGSLTVTGNGSLDSVGAPALTTVGGSLIIGGNDDLDDVDLGNVTGVDGDVFVGGNGQLVLIDLGALLAIGGDLSLLDNDALVAFVLAALTSVAGNVTVLGNGALADTDLSSLTTVGGSLTVTDNGEDASLDVGALSAVGGSLAIDDTDTTFQDGFSCDAQGNCVPVCGDGLLLAGELCDDDNTADGDGCSALCAREDGFLCAGSPSVCVADADDDGVVDDLDVCPTRADPGQRDTDGDGRGDLCDTDDDNDGVADTVDLCPTVADATQRDRDGDGRGDACSDDASDEAGDFDNDGVDDAADHCPERADASNADTDDDGIGDVCDVDADDDGIANLDDACPLVAGVACENDGDGDGIADAIDLCPGIAAGNDDLDGDGLGDACDSDVDGDGVVDRLDGCPREASIESEDDDNDGAPDACDRCPNTDDRLADAFCAVARDDDGGCASSGTPAPTVLFGLLLVLRRRRQR